MMLSTLSSLQSVDSRGHRRDNLGLAVLEVASVAWFTAEYLVRLLACPDKCAFLQVGGLPSRRDAVLLLDKIRYCSWFHRFKTFCYRA